MPVDLHTHSAFSDGTTAPEENARLAAAAGLSGLALTDHDTLAGWARAADACAREGLQFVPGVELSTELAERSVHVLGYWVDAAHAALVQECDRLRDERLHRARLMLERLAEHGIDIPLEAVLTRAAGAPVGRPHVAAAMIDAGVVCDREEAFERWIADGGPAWVPKHAISPEDGVRLIRAAGGVAVLAHPGVSTRDAPVDVGVLDALVAAGLGGVEADHAGHDAQTAATWRRLAWERDLVVTGASDFHGEAKDVAIGAQTTPAEVVDALHEQATKEGAPW